MSAEGGDTGGGGSGGGGDSGGGGKGGGGKGGGGGGNDAPISYGGYSDPSASSPPASGGGDYSPPSSYSDPSTSSGGGGGLPPEITTGGSGGGGGGGMSLDDLIGGGGGSDGLNLAGSGPVGGSSPAISGGMFSTGSDTASAFVPDTAGDAGMTAPTGGGGTSAAAFAAPEGISGSPQLTDLVKQPSGSDAGAGGIGSDIAASGPGQGVSDMLSGLNAAEKDVTDQWAAQHASSVPSIGSDAGAPTSMGGSGSGGGGGSGSGGGSGLSLGSNPLGTAVAGAGLLNNMVSGNKSPAYSPQLNATAAAAGATGAQQTAAGTALQQYVATGTLPAGYESQVQQAAQAAKATITANYANRGLPTDPSRNSMLAQELAQVDAKIPAMREQIAGTLAQTGSGMIQSGLQATGIQSGVYQSLANLQDKQNQQRAQAIANFAASLNGGVKSRAA